MHMRLSRRGRARLSLRRRLQKTILKRNRSRCSYLSSPSRLFSAALFPAFHTRAAARTAKTGRAHSSSARGLVRQHTACLVSSGGDVSFFTPLVRADSRRCTNALVLALVRLLSSFYPSRGKVGFPSLGSCLILLVNLCSSLLPTWPAMAALRVVGQHKGLVTLNLDTATVLDLKNAVSRDSGLPVAGLKLLAGMYSKTFVQHNMCKRSICGEIFCDFALFFSLSRALGRHHRPSLLMREGKPARNMVSHFFRISCLGGMGYFYFLYSSTPPTRRERERERALRRYYLDIADDLQRGFAAGR